MFVRYYFFDIVLNGFDPCTFIDIQSLGPINSQFEAIIVFVPWNHGTFVGKIFSAIFVFFSMDHTYTQPNFFKHIHNKIINVPLLLFLKNVKEVVLQMTDLFDYIFSFINSPWPIKYSCIRCSMIRFDGNHEDHTSTVEPIALNHLDESSIESDVSTKRFEFITNPLWLLISITASSPGWL